MRCAALGLLVQCAAFAPRTLTRRANVMRAGATIDVEQVADKAEVFDFSADVSRVMEIIINSLYSDKDVFLRELVSNSADACDKKRFMSLTDTSMAAADSLRVRITADKAARTLTIEDSGIGMNREELVNNLGRIAMSGTKKFAEALGDEAPDNVNLIGQFGVGFYSGFLVADWMAVTSKSVASAEQYTWRSDAKSGYTIGEAVVPIEGESGTRIVLSLKEDCGEYLDEFKLRTLLKRYSEFVQFPIELLTEKTTYEDVPDESAAIDVDAEGEAAEPKTKSVAVKSSSWEAVNTQRPLWLRPPKEVTPLEYSDFYKSAFKAYDEPLAHAHFSLEGQVQFKALLYVPSVLPYELTRNMFETDNAAIKLYVKRVFINGKFEDLVPRWLTFLRGVVDSEDLPLNVGREILQKSKMLSIISKRVTRQAMKMFNTIAKNETQYATFWTNYGKYIKVGLVEEQGDLQQDLAKLCRFSSTKSGEDGLTTLAEYAARLPANATRILYVSADSKRAAMQSPVLEKLRTIDYEVIYLVEPLDELAVQSIGEFDGKRLVDAATEDLGDIFSSVGAPDIEQVVDEPSFDDLKAFVKATLGDKIGKVELSKRLTESPAALVQGQYGMSPVMKRYMAAQATAANDASLNSFGQAAPTLELNPSHKIVQDLKRELAQTSAAGDNPKAAETALLMYDVASLTCGYDLDDPSAFAQRVTRMMASTATAPAVADAPAAPAAAVQETLVQDAVPVVQEDAPVEGGAV